MVRQDLIGRFCLKTRRAVVSVVVGSATSFLPFGILTAQSLWFLVVCSDPTAASFICKSQTHDRGSVGRQHVKGHSSLIGR